jgi:hypothetical protein
MTSASGSFAFQANYSKAVPLYGSFFNDRPGMGWVSSGVVAETTTKARL